MLLIYFDFSKECQYICYQAKYPELPWEDVITRVNIGLDKKFYSEVNKIKYPDCITVLVNKYNQLSEDYIPCDLEIINQEFNSGELVLRHEARMAFEIMCKSALEEDIHLEAISTFRSFHYQNEVYYRKLTPDLCLKDYMVERDRVSARPGHSEHQTGLAVDINDLEQTFENTKEGQWLAKNSYDFGFLLRYPKGKENITGYDYEPWHFRYFGKSLAKRIKQSDLTYDEYYVRHIPFE